MAKSRKKKAAKRKPAKAAAKGKSAKGKSAKRAKRKLRRRKSPARNPAPKGGGPWPMIFVAVLALLVGMAAGWHIRDSGMAAHAAPGAQTRSAKPAAVRAGRQAVDHWLKTVASGNTAAARAVPAPDRQSVRRRLPEFADAPQGDRPVPPLTVSARAATPGSW